MTREEIKDLIEMNYENNIDGLVDFIFDLESDLLKNKKGLETARLVITNSVSKDRYNDIVKKYNKLAKKREV
jgi:hypothetical protein